MTNLLNWIRSHGSRACIVDGGILVFTDSYDSTTGRTYRESTTVRNLSEARAVLGY